MSSADRTAGRIDWPAWADRTPAADRTGTSKFRVTMAQALEDVEKVLLGRLGVDDWRLSTAAPHRKDDGRPYANADPDDPGAVVRWSMDGEQYAVACDEYTDLRDNIRAIGLYIEEKRKMSNRPVRTGQDEFATARLPSGNEEDAIAAAPPPHEVLGVAPDAPENVVKAAARELTKEHHPDRGGDADQFKRVRRAKEAMPDVGPCVEAAPRRSDACRRRRSATDLSERQSRVPAARSAAVFGLLLRWRRSMRFASVRRDRTHPSVRCEEISIRDIEEPDIGIRNVHLEHTSELKSRGIGSLYSQAHDDIEDRLDVDRYRGEHVATVYYDLDSWEYAIEWEVEVPLLQRLRRLILGRGGDGR